MVAPNASATATPSTYTDPTEPIALDGSGSTDSDGTIVSYQWEVVSGPYGMTAGLDTPTATTCTLTPGGETPPPPAASTPLGPTGTYNLRWEDDFEGTSVDSTKWKHGETGFASDYDKHDATVIINPTANELSVQNGYATIKARHSQYAVDRGQVMTTTLLTSHTKAFENFTHGVVEARLRHPKGKSLWPAFWLLGNGTNENPPAWPETGEIDILEFFNSDEISGVHVAPLHFGRNADTVYTPSGTMWKADNVRIGDVDQHGGTYTVRPYWTDGGWHTYTFERTSTIMRTWVDGNLIYTYAPTDNSGNGWKTDPGHVDGGYNTPGETVPQLLFDTPMHIRFDLQVGGEATWDTGTGPIFDEGDLDIDYVRVWEPA